MLFKSDIIEFSLNRKLFLTNFYNYHIKTKIFSFLSKKKWKKYFTTRNLPINKKKWKNYNIKIINKLDKFYSHINSFNYNLYTKSIEADFLSMTFFIILKPNNIHQIHNFKLFNKLFSGNISKFKYLNWKFIN